MGRAGPGLEKVARFRGLDPTADNLAVFRQQALIIARRKEQAAE